MHSILIIRSKDKLHYDVTKQLLLITFQRNVVKNSEYIRVTKSLRCYLCTGGNINKWVISVEEFNRLVTEQMKTMDRLLFLQSELERCQEIENS